MGTEQWRWSLAADGHAGGLQRSGCRGIPLLEQGLVPTFYTFFIQDLSQRALSPLHEYETEEAFCPNRHLAHAIHSSTWLLFYSARPQKSTPFPAF